MWGDHGGRLERASRRWTSMGVQQVPVRAVLDGAGGFNADFNLIAPNFNNGNFN